MGVGPADSTPSMEKARHMGKRLAQFESFQGYTDSTLRENEPLFNERNTSIVKTKLEGIASKSRNEKNLRFTSIAHLISPDLVLSHLQKMQSSSAKGVDGESVKEAKDTFDKWINPMLQSVHRKGYKAPAVRRVQIPKPGRKEKRPIGIPTVSDRALQGAVAEVLSAIYEQDFLPNSFGGRASLSCHHAVINIASVVNRGKANWVLECDLKNFFGSMSHEWIMKFVSHRVGDPRILNLILRWLRAGVVEDGTWSPTEIGTPQGGPISVLLSNLYMHYVLDIWFVKMVKDQLSGDAELIRYLDDFVIIFQKESDAKRVLKALEERIPKFGLSLNYEKTRLLPFGRFSFEKKEAPGNFQFLGFNIYEAKSRSGKFRIGLKASKERVHRGMVKLKAEVMKNRHAPVAWQAFRINQSLRGMFNYYCFSDCAADQYRIRYEIMRTWYRALGSRSQRHLSWKKFYRILQWNPLQKTKVRIKFNAFEQFLRL